MPDTPSEPLATTPTGWLNQPLLSGCRSSPALIDGCVASNLTVNAALLAFPAASEQLPPSDAPPVSGPAYVNGGLQAATPETGSVATKLTVTGSRYQPFSPPRSGTAFVTGGVASYASDTPAGALVFPALSVHVPDTCCAEPSGPE